MGSHLLGCLLAPSCSGAIGTLSYGHIDVETAFMVRPFCAHHTVLRDNLESLLRILL